MYYIYEVSTSAVGLWSTRHPRRRRQNIRVVTIATSTMTLSTIGVTIKTDVGTLSCVCW